MFSPLHPSFRLEYVERRFRLEANNRCCSTVLIRAQSSAREKYKLSFAVASPVETRRGAFWEFVREEFIAAFSRRTRERSLRVTKTFDEKAERVTVEYFYEFVLRFLAIRRRFFRQHERLPDPREST